jgi:hypothetical protein
MTMPVTFAFCPAIIGIWAEKPSVRGDAGVAQSSQIQPAIPCGARRRLAYHGVPGPMGVAQMAQVSRSSTMDRCYAMAWVEATTGIEPV